jgi:general secretion pathway protein J
MRRTLDARRGLRRGPCCGSNCGSNGGFTLIELLVAISILAIVAVLGWRGLDGIVRAREVLTAQMEQSRGMQLAFAQMQSDAEHLASARTVRQRQNLLVEEGRLTLVRTVLAENEPARVAVVAYRINNGLLVRSESNATRDLIALDALWQAALSGTDPAAAVGLQAGVTGMALRTWQSGEWRSATAALTSGTPASTAAAAAAAGVPEVVSAQVPTGLEVALQLQGQSTALVKVFLLGPL